MTGERLKIKLNEIAFSQTYSECALYCRELLEAAVSYIYDKIESRKPKNVSLLELISIDIDPQYDTISS